MLPVACAVALSLSAFAAVRTGSTQSDRVERIVSERVIESHEEMAEAFLAASAGVVLIALAGLIGGVTGRTARLLTGVGALTLAGLVVRVGHTGGQLVYRYGAGAAYTQTGGPTGATGGGSASGQLRGDHDAR